MPCAIDEVDGTDVTSEQTRPTSLYPELDEGTLMRFFEALVSGDTGRLAPSRAAEVDQARGLVAPVRVKVPGADGVELDGVLWKQRTGAEQCPGIVMPSPWTGLGWLVYVVQATRFALAGYNVLTYTTRGFGASGGEVEVAGDLDVKDASRALDYLIEQAGATRVGFLGDSYGSGISQLAAAQDERIDAVVALSTWGDLGEAFYENTTRHMAAVQTLLGAAQQAGARLSTSTQRAFGDVLSNQNVEATLKWAAERSPLTYVERINRREVPVYFAHAWHETLFPTNQTLKMFHALTGPKRINLSIGDHSSPEMTGMVGLPNRIWEDAHRWLNHHLKGVENGIGGEGQVISQIMWNKTLESRPTWDAVTGRTERLYLAAAPAGEDDGALTDKPASAWSTVFQTSADTPATVAGAIITTGYAEMAGNPKTYPTGDISHADAGVWTSTPMAVAARLRGIPRLHLTYTPSAGQSTFIAHLFDVAADGSAHIITHAPFTSLDADPGQPVTTDVELQATGYDIPAGHRLMLVLDGTDPFYGDANQPRATLTIASSQDDPSYLDIPLS